MEVGTASLSPVNSLAGTRRGSKLALYADAEAAERLLVLADFGRAAEAGLSLLKSTFYAADSEDVRTRGAFVYIQAMFEIKRFHEVYPTLMAEYGCLDKLDCDTLLLWVALALDEGIAHEAGEVLLEFLANCQVIKSRGSYERIQHNGPILTEAQYEGAVRMYTSEVLGRELGLWKDAMDWVLESARYLPFQTREALVQELASLQAASACAPVRVAANAPVVPAEEELSTGHQHPVVQPPQLEGQGLDPWRPPHLLQANCPPSPLSPKQMEYAGDGTPRSPGSAGPGAWIAATSARLMEICGQDNQDGWYAMPASLTVATAMGGVIAYAAYAERDTISKGLKRVAGSVFGSIGEVFRVATAMNPNPLSLAHL